MTTNEAIVASAFVDGAFDAVSSIGTFLSLVESRTRLAFSLVKSVANCMIFVMSAINVKSVLMGIPN